VWDEDPRWLDAQYKLVVWSVAILGVLALLASALYGDWAIAGWYFGGLAVLLGAVCIYGAVVWVLVRGVQLLGRICNRVFRGRKNG
jgi:hypothetical protein